MTTQANKPTHRLIRYYGRGQHAARAELGAVWTNDVYRLELDLTVVRF